LRVSEDLLGQSEDLKAEFARIHETKDIEIAGLKLKVKELEDKFHDVKMND
jgi:hypothetical protein